MAEIYTEGGQPTKGAHTNWGVIVLVAAVILALIIIAIARS
jgi:hypothetical protein